MNYFVITHYDGLFQNLFGPSSYEECREKIGSYADEHSLFECDYDKDMVWDENGRNTTSARIVKAESI